MIGSDILIFPDAMPQFRSLLNFAVLYHERVFCLDVTEEDVAECSAVLSRLSDHVRLGATRSVEYLTNKAGIAGAPLTASAISGVLGGVAAEIFGMTVERKERLATDSWSLVVELHEQYTKEP